MRGAGRRSNPDPARRVPETAPLARLAGGGGFGGGAPAAAEKGALLLMPGGALGGIDNAVMVGIHLLEPLAKPAVALCIAEPRKPVVIRLGLFEPGALDRKSTRLNSSH